MIEKLRQAAKKLIYSSTNSFCEDDVISEYFILGGSLESINYDILKSSFYRTKDLFNGQMLVTEDADSIADTTKGLFDISGELQCKKCLNIDSVSSFSVYRSSSSLKNIVYPYCKKCVRAANKKRYSDEKYAEAMRKRSQECRKNPGHSSYYRSYKRKWYSKIKDDPSFKEKRNAYQRAYRSKKILKPNS